MKKIIVYATDRDGEGKVIKIGEYYNVVDIEIPVGHFAPDVIISFEDETTSRKDPLD
jgi:hypothetical protein